MKRLISAVAVLCTLPACAAADQQAEMARILGTAKGEVHACFLRRYSPDFLSAHSDRNVREALIYVSRSGDEEPIYGLNLQIRFKNLDTGFQAYGSCLPIDPDSKPIYCGFDCDGGAIHLSPLTNQSVAVTGRASVRDPVQDDPSLPLPDGAGYRDGDRDFELQRTELKDCLPLIYDDKLKAEISQGLRTQ